MKRVLTTICIVVFFLTNIYSTGVVFENGKTNSYLTLLQSSVVVNVENQVAITKTTQTFLNEIGDSLSVRYAFPLPENSSAVQLRLMINSVWYTASFSASPQDTTTGGGSGDVDYKLIKFLGPNPLYYSIDIKLDSLSEIMVELTYVELLEYKFGKVNYTFPNDYSLIQTSQQINQEFSFHLNSERTISDISFLSHSGANVVNNGQSASIEYMLNESPANFDYSVRYGLSQDELGLYSLSTYLPDSLQKDELGRGFFALIVEPDPSENAEVISKVFTLIIDRSGSMSGNKIVQARDAATFIVNNLNDEDEFNIISFSSNITAFRGNHVEYTINNKNAALDYISSLVAVGSTNISGAFDLAIPQFSITDGSKANIILFFTDGEQTAGITNTNDLIAHINTLFVMSEKDITLFNFGIGSYTNEQLLTSTAATNDGLVEFLGDEQLEEVITEFYLMVKNPVLLNTELSISPDLLNGIYPTRLPNLYQGQQMLLVGRYAESVPVSLDLSGTAFSQQVLYEYDLDLAGTDNANYQFLTKIWAKMKIEDLMERYYLNFSNTDTTEYFKTLITQISLDYGVISPFTSFQGWEDTGNYYTVSMEEHEIDVQNDREFSNKYLKRIKISPIPTNDILFINILTESFVDDNLLLSLYESNGRRVYLSSEYIAGDTEYKFEIDINNLHLKPGLYLLSLQIREEIITFKIIIG